MVVPLFSIGRGKPDSSGLSAEMIHLTADSSIGLGSSSHGPSDQSEVLTCVPSPMPNRSTTSRLATPCVANSWE